ncbi:MAG: nickel-dependent hydrogenase large subunit, partial [Bifidobacteriaceae bacterium]|jgi:hydrogenase large subunit|nr:nickel-dependent hydrogenase large subunit [Bifidobacteriaceae bacterium]
MACTIDPNKSESINQVQIDQIQQWVDETYECVVNCYVPDAMAIAGVYSDYFDVGASSPNYLAVGLSGAVIGGDPNNSRVTSAHTAIRPGVLLDGDLDTVHMFEPSEITEWVHSAWYTYEGGDIGVAPAEGETTVAYDGPKPPYTGAPGDGLPWLSDKDKYTWCKAPRYAGRPTQVGPVARVLLAYAQGHALTKSVVDDALETLQITRKQLNSTMGRTLARAVECLISATALKEETFPNFVNRLRAGDIEVFDSTRWEPGSWPADCQGYAFVEVARGNLSHWVHIKDGKVERYQAVVPTTWLAGGRDAKGQQGPYEESLAGNGQHPLADPAQPLEPLRTIHSFDPCMSCAVHVLDPDGQELRVVTS